ncbi:MAG: hypothetical protein KME21_12935 [Desmonostoc vinosum HA7617-LM4]|jgi:energy-coupling factor transporter ATP-binding protein EcfA2|nr:hypothetical protein [Desmonostoc vinosum HA7617-LM4]
MVFNRNLKNQTTQATQVKTIRVVGDRAAGKTTYLTALACLSGDDPDSPVKRVVAMGEETENLVRKAKDCLDSKQEISPNVYGDGIEKSYVFKIEFKEKSLPFSYPTVLGIQCKDYPGEFFCDLKDKNNPELLEKYIKDCVEATGILLLLDGTARRDGYYTDCIREFLIQLDRSSSQNAIPNRRVAIALTKCDREELWIHRDSPRDKIMARFQGVNGQLQNLKYIHVDYFATSAFGMLGNEYEISNSTVERTDDSGTRAIIKESNSRLWRPFGLVEPIYWLYTGKRY